MRALATSALAVMALACTTARISSGGPQAPAAMVNTRLPLMDADGAFDTTRTFRRIGDEPGQSRNRHYMKSIQADLISSDWTFRLTFHTPANAPDDIVFVGLGEAVPDPSFFNEPRNSVNFRIHQGATAFGGGWRVDVAAHDIGYFSWTYDNEGVCTLPGPEGGTHTIQIRKRGIQMTFEIVDAQVSVTIPDMVKAAPFLYTHGSRIFFGNASGAYDFEGPEFFISR